MKKAISIILVFTAAICTVAALARFSYSPNNTKNGFLRNFTVPNLVLEKNETFAEELKEICGITSTQVYFSTATPGKIVASGHDLTKQEIITVPIPPGRITKKNPIFYQVTFPNIFVYEGNIPGITIYSITGEKKSTSTLEKGAFSRITHINGNIFVMRKINRKLRDQRFVKYNTANSQLAPEKNISIPSTDMGLSADGKLYYDETSNRLCYIQLYINEFITFDTNLNLIGRYKTIDTSNISKFSSAIIGVTPTSSNKIVTNDKPVQIINKAGCVDKGMIYIHSKLKADNESEAAEKNAAIDMYDLKTGRYAGSFYIPWQKGEPLHRFMVYGDKVFAVYKNSVAVYTVKL